MMLQPTVENHGLNWSVCACSGRNHTELGHRLHVPGLLSQDFLKVHSCGLHYCISAFSFLMVQQHPNLSLPYDVSLLEELADAGFHSS